MTKQSPSDQDGSIFPPVRAGCPDSTFEESYKNATTEIINVYAMNKEFENN